ncbi:MAG: endolytic transglycosylase MltG [Pyrinomonadaceae bacterium]
MKKTIIRLIIGLVLLLVVVAGVSMYWANRSLRIPRTHAFAGQYVEIPRGTAPAEIINRLSAKGIIGNTWPVLLYLKYSGAGSRLKAGEYKFPSPITALEVIHRLEEGEDRLDRFTVIEGWSRFEIAAALAKQPFFHIKEDAAFALLSNPGPIQDVDPMADNLEGYLYPDTYFLPQGTTAEQAVALMIKRFHQEWKPEYTARAEELHLTPRQIATVAALIETEAKLDEDRPLISSVIYNRLKTDMPLGIDSAIIYASKLAGKWKNDGKVYKSDLDRQSPYNTRLNRGLPPGPIASFSRESLRAALYPAQTEYLFYVREPSRNDGKHNFYTNGADFEKGVRALRDWERKRDLEASKLAANATP